VTGRSTQPASRSAVITQAATASSPTRPSCSQLETIARRLRSIGELVMMAPSTAPPSLTGAATTIWRSCQGQSVAGMPTCRPASAPRTARSVSFRSGGPPNTLTTCRSWLTSMTAMPYSS
jgi:hypothetical protein